MKKIVVLLVVLLGCMPVTAFAQKQFFFKDGKFCSSTVYRFALDAGFCKMCRDYSYYPCCLGG